MLAHDTDLGTSLHSSTGARPQCQENSALEQLELFIVTSGGKAFHGGGGRWQWNWAGGKLPQERIEPGWVGRDGGRLPLNLNTSPRPWSPKQETHGTAGDLDKGTNILLPQGGSSTCPRRWDAVVTILALLFLQAPKQRRIGLLILEMQDQL